MAEHTTNLEAIKKSITEKTEGGLTSKELAELRKEIGCLSPDAIAELKKFFDAGLNAIHQDTRTKLDSLLKECKTSIESKESTDTFGKVFEGTKSEMLNREHIEVLKGYILTKFEFPGISPSQKDNLATATIDRLLSDKAFSGIVGDVSGGITGAVKSLEKGGITGVMNAFKNDDKKPEATKEGEIKAKVESSATGLEKRILELIDGATKPLIELISKKPVGLDRFLSNTQEIASYNGSGVIRADIAPMSDSEKGEYVKSLNKRVLEIDGKIIPLEAIKEKGMDFIATAPNWMQDVFKWLLSLPFIGNLLSSFLGYKNGAEALSGMDEELRQRKSIVALREFRTVNADGTKYEGKHAGKIDILKGKNLSKIDRKKLVKFFKFTAEEGINTTSPDFWIGVFEKGGIIKKDDKGAEIKYEFTSKLGSEDIGKDFKGFYEKLNRLIDTRDEKKTKDAAEESKKQEQDQKIKGRTELAAKQEEALKIAKEMTPYKNLAEGLIVNTLVLEKLNNLTVDDFINGKYLERVGAIWKKSPERDNIVKVLDTYASLLSNEKVKSYIAGLKGTMTGPVDFRTLSNQRYNILTAAGYTGEFLKQQEAKIADATKAQEEAKKQVEKADYLAKRDEEIKKVISSTMTFPVVLPVWKGVNTARGKELGVDYPTGKIDYDANKEQLSIGNKNFSLKVKPYQEHAYGKDWDITDAKITSIRVNGDNFELRGRSEEYKRDSKEPIQVKKSEMPELIIALLDGKEKLPLFADKIKINQV